MKCKYCNSENLILEKRSKDNKHILDAQQVALICGDCGKYIKWCPKDERKFYWIKMIAPSPTKAKTELNINSKDNQIAELKQQLAEMKERLDACQELRKLEAEEANKQFMSRYQELADMEKQLAAKDKEILDWKDGTMIVKYEQQLAITEKALDYAIFELDFAINHSQSTTPETFKRIDKLKNKILNQAKETLKSE